MQFTKMHGLGNDFVFVQESEFAEKTDYNALSVKICDRNFGVGADGLVILGNALDYDITMRIFNPDGSEPEMCGNAIRCVGKYAWENGLVKEKRIRVKTLAGLIMPEVIVENGKVTQVKVDMGEPILTPAQVPVDLPGEKIVNEAITVSDKEFRFTAVSMGNPHCVIFVGSLDEGPAAKWGPALEVHNYFPRKTNVEFVEIISRSEMKMNVWERGAGETLACGTGACATLVAAVLNDKTDARATIHLKGGDLVIEWDTGSNHVYMTGPATEVFRGTLAPRSL